MKTPQICTVISTPDLKAIRQAHELTDLFELRIDLIYDSWESIAQSISKPWIATCRSKKDNGEWKGTNEKRIETLLKAVELGAAIVDIELETTELNEIVHQIKPKAKCLISYHDWSGTPSLSYLHVILKKQKLAKADICKIVTTANNAGDNLAVLQLVRESGKTPVTSFAMGTHGQLSRLFCPLFGGCFTYASLTEDVLTASGQLSLNQMRHIYSVMKPC